MVNPIPLLDGLDERLSELAESSWVVDVEALYEVSCRRQGNRIDVGGAEIRDRHEDCCGGTGGSVWRHRNISIGGAEWKRVG